MQDWTKTSPAIAEHSIVSNVLDLDNFFVRRSKTNAVFLIIIKLAFVSFFVCFRGFCPMFSGCAVLYDFYSIAPLEVRK